MTKNFLDVFSKTMGRIQIQMIVDKTFQFNDLEWNPNPEFIRPFRWIGPDGSEWFRPKYGNFIFNIKWKLN